MRNPSCVRGKIHIVYDVSYPFVEGGGQKRIYEIAKRLVTRGWEVRWFTFKTWDGASDIVQDGIRYIGLDGYVPLYAADGRRSPREALAFGRAVWSRRHVIRSADVVWCGQWPYSHLMPLMFGGTARLYVDWWEVWGSHWFEYFGRLKGLIGYCIEKLLVALCSRRGIVIAISTRGTRDITACNAKAESVYMIPNGIDINHISRVSASKEPVDLVYVGRLKDHKNVDHIVRALHLLKMKYGITLNVVIIGRGPEEPDLRTLSQELGVVDQINFLGSVNDDEKYARMKSATLFVHPSTKEGGGSLTVLEAHACGIPVMIYNSPQGIDAEFVSEGVTGWIISPVAPAALAERLADLFQDDKLQRGFMQRNCQDAASMFDWEKIAEKYDRIFSGSIT